MFCAPRPTGEPDSAESMAWRKIAGGQTATMTSAAWPTPALTASASALAASADPGFIFQLPAMNRVRFISPDLPMGRRLGRADLQAGDQNQVDHLSSFE